MILKELQIEEKLIAKLSELKYTYREDICDRKALEKNFRNHFEKLNRVTLTDSEFAKLRDEIVNADVFAAAKTLREPNTFTREDGTPLQYTLVNIKDWCKNEFEVVNQLRINTEVSHHRYDVIILINGIPVVQIELKTLDISPRRAMEQIVDYKNDPGNGYTNTLLCFMQLFIVSNETNTYYFANNSKQHFSFNADERFLPIYQFANEENKKVTYLYDFADKFLVKCTLGKMISRYMVLVVSEQKLMVMRPYQIYAVKAIVDCIHQNRGYGYIWHTTGSGKTLTSFKTATLLKDNPDIEKCLFVVDRKDLDRQTREEFNKFQEGCVEENTNTETLVQRMLSEDYANKVIVTTIQKLGLALDETSKHNQNNKQKGKSTYKERLSALRDKRIVFIFDECHRSQFGENHAGIKKFFPKAQLFGFTGTPIFNENAVYKKVDSTEASYKTTADLFEKELHAYTITEAIDDKNVLRFHIDSYTPPKEVKLKAGDPLSQQAVVDSILKKHDDATRLRQFNAIFATSSINSAIEYYDLFKTVQAQKQASDTEYQPLNIACVFSPPTQLSSTDENNKNLKNRADVKQLQEDLQQERQDNLEAPEEKKAALTRIIQDYNKQYGTNHSINEFDLYYQDIQKRIKDQQYPNKDYPHKNKIDIVIVVDMLLTGFDSKYLNTLYVDKNLKYHSLIQAFSRTNRVLNDTKPYGNILDFRCQDKAVDEAIILFSGKSKDRAKAIWLVDPAQTVIDQLQQAVSGLEQFMQLQDLPYEPHQVNNLKGDSARVDFIKRFKEIQRFKTQLDQYTDLSETQKAHIEQMLPQNQLRAFKGAYLDIAQRLKAQQDANRHNASLSPNQATIDDLDFEFVLFATAIIDYDYIMKLIAQYTQKPAKQKMTRQQLVDLLCSSSNLMDEKDDIIAYIDSLEGIQGLSVEEVHQGYQVFKDTKITNRLIEIAHTYGLEAQALQAFVDGIMSRMIFDGERLTDLLAPLDLGWKARSKKEEALMQDLIPELKKLAQGRKISGLAVYE